MHNNILSQFAQSCTAGIDVSIGIPTWYKGLSCDEFGAPRPSQLNDLWVIGVNIIDILLFATSVVAVFFLIYGGIQYTVSQGQPDKLSSARRTLTYAIVGLVVAILARVAVQFIAQNIFQTTQVRVDA